MGVQDLGNSGPNGQNDEAKLPPLKAFLEKLNLDEAFQNHEDLSNSSLLVESISGEWGVRLIRSKDDLLKLAEEIKIEPVLTLVLGHDSTGGMVALGLPGREEVVIAQEIGFKTLSTILNSYSGKVVTFDPKIPGNITASVIENYIDLHQVLIKLIPEFLGKDLGAVSRLVLRDSSHQSANCNQIEKLHHDSEIIYKLFQKFDQLLTKSESITTDSEREREFKEIAEAKLALLGKDLDRYLELRAREEFLKRKL